MNSRQRRAQRRKKAETEFPEADRGVQQGGSGHESDYGSPTEPAQNTAILSENQGVGGDTLRSDLQIIRRAIRNDWPIDPGTRQRVVSQMVTLAESAEDERTRVSAAKTLISADAINARRESTDIAAEKDSKSTINVNVDNRRVLILPSNNRDPLPAITGAR